MQLRRELLQHARLIEAMVIFGQVRATKPTLAQNMAN
jgi:hypothetical protein